MSSYAFAPAFDLQVEPDRERVIVRPRGELDLVSVRRLRDAVDELLTTGFRSLVVDLRGLTFIDSSGLHCLMELAARAQDDGVELTIVQGPREVRRIFEMTDTLDALPFAERA